MQRSRGIVPSPRKLRDFVTTPPSGGDRYYCTMIKHDNDTYGDYWTLYLEHLGGLFPLLKARKSSKLRPEFVIFDPVGMPSETQEPDDSYKSSSELSSFDSDTDAVDIGCGSPKSQRKDRRRRKLEKRDKESAHHQTENTAACIDGLPEKKTLVEVSSNIWGTKFRIIGSAPYLPRDLGQVVYKSSLLHLQPRQMSLAITEMKNGNGCHGNESHSSLCSEEEEEVLTPSAESALVTSSGGDFVIVPEAGITQTHFKDVECLDKSHRELFLVQSASSSGELIVHTRGDNSGERGDNPGECDRQGDVIDDNKTDQKAIIGDRDSEHIIENGIERGSGEVYQTSHESQGAIPKNLTLNLQPSITVNQMNVTSGRKVRLQSRSKEQARSMCKRCSQKLSATLCSLCRSDYGPVISANANNAQDTYGDLHIMSSDFHKNLKYIDEDSDDEEKEFQEIKDALLKGVSMDSCVEIEKFQPEEDNRKWTDKKIEDVGKCENSVVQSNGFKPINELRNNKNTRNLKFSKQGSVGATDVSGLKNLSDTDSVKSNSMPPSPAKNEILNGGGRLHERQLNKSSQSIESSDDEILLSGDEMTTSYSYRDLESFQKAQLRQKMRKGRSKSDGEGMVARKQFIMHNKAPLWNENSQVYQLDFGGRVTQESAKNFQIEFRGKQVMQFGRIDLNKYTLDFQYPFSGIQAFAVALANVTQRLK